MVHAERGGTAPGDGRPVATPLGTPQLKACPAVGRERFARKLTARLTSAARFAMNVRPLGAGSAWSGTAGDERKRLGTAGHGWERLGTKTPGSPSGAARRSRLAEDTGFEPVRAINPTRFPIVRLRPLGQSSAEKGTGPRATADSGSELRQLRLLCHPWRGRGGAVMARAMAEAGASPSVSPARPICRSDQVLRPVGGGRRLGRSGGHVGGPSAPSSGRHGSRPSMVTSTVRWRSHASRVSTKRWPVRQRPPTAWRAVPSSA